MVLKAYLLDHATFYRNLLFGSKGLRLIITHFTDGWQGAVFKGSQSVAGDGLFHSNRRDAEDDARVGAEQMLGKKLDEINWTSEPIKR
jgi:hypothetical protein